jgi:hypothetical protein
MPKRQDGLESRFVTADREPLEQLALGQAGDARPLRSRHRSD